MKAVRVRARADLHIRVPERRSDPSERTEAVLQAIDTSLEAVGFDPDKALPGEGDLATIPVIEVLEAEWTRNPPSVPDTAEIVIRRNAAPVDLRLFRHIMVDLWLFVHESYGETLVDRMRRCEVGDPGHVRLVVVSCEEEHPNESPATWRLSCQDLTRIPLQEEMTPDLMRKIDLDGPLVDVVRTFMQALPGGEHWEVYSRGKVATYGSPSAFLAEERFVTVERPDPLAAITDHNEGAFITTVPSIKQAPRVVIDGEEFVAAVPFDSVVDEAALPLTVRTVVRQSVPAKLADIIGTSKRSIWQAVTRLCQRMGVVPEVGTTADGRPGVWLVSADEFQTTKFFRAFERDGKPFRRVTVGRDVFGWGASRDFLGGQQVDFVEVVAADPDSGKTRRASYGKRGLGDTRGHGRTIAAHGTTDQAHLEGLAQAAWRSSIGGEFALSFSITVPWTTGGSPDNPDALDLASGAAVAFDFEGRDRFEGVTTQQALQRLGVPEEAATVLARASNRLRPSTIFQVAEMHHSFRAEDDGDYVGTVRCQAYLDDDAEADRIAVDEVA